MAILPRMAISVLDHRVNLTAQYSIHSNSSFMRFSTMSQHGRILKWSGFCVVAFTLFTALTQTSKAKPASATDVPAPNPDYNTVIREDLKEINGIPVDSKIWGIGYWQDLADKGLISVTTETPSPEAQMSEGGQPNAQIADTPDVLIRAGGNITQSENSVFIHPTNSATVLNSNNSSAWPVNGIFYGASRFFSTNSGLTWAGSEQGAGGTNRGDPAAVIDLSGNYFVGYIASDGGMGVARSTNSGATWTHVQVTPGSGLDKNHLWVDNSTASAYDGNLYNAWTTFNGGTDYGEIQFSRSTDAGLAWSAPVILSSAINAGSHNQGVNIQTGPNGEVYATWAIYDTWPAPENAMGFARSFDGGATWEPAQRILANIKGIRLLALGGGKTMRVNSFPSVTTDTWGNLTIVWTNQGVPGVNTGDPNIYTARSKDRGVTWSTPVRVNQDSTTRDQWMPWVASDPLSENLVAVFLDSRDFVNNDMAETRLALSTDGGATWTDLQVSDAAWPADAIPGFAPGYAGDYLGVDILDHKIYPVWSDTRSGNILAYTSPITLVPQGCAPPASGTWAIAGACTLSATTTPPGDVWIFPTGSLTLQPGVTLDIDFSSKVLRIKDGGKIVIQAGAKVD